jgi:DNA-binding response OmpR family regulator
MPITCLIAAHDPWFIQLLRIYSEESGLRVVQVYEGQDVLPMIFQEKPVAVFLQADLPGRIKGWEVLHLIKLDPVACHIPVLVFSWPAHMSAEDAPVSLIDGAAAHLQEPVTYEIFQDALKKVGVGLSGSRPFEQPPNLDTSVKKPYTNGKSC